MPQVPEITAPSVEPAGAPDITQRINGISPEAFGSNIGVALQSAGGQLEKTAGEYQDIANQATARDLSIKYMTDLGSLEAGFYQKEGKAALDAQPGYVKSIQALRQQYLGQTGNPMVSRMLDQEMANQTSRAIIQGSMHAGQQAKAYNDQTLKAGIELEQKNSWQDQTDGEFQQRLSRINDTVDKQAQNNGWDAKTTELNRQNAAAGAYRDRTLAILDHNPLQAKQFLDSIKGKLPGDMQYQLDNVVKEKALSVSARAIADKQISAGPIGTQKEREEYAMAQLTPVFGVKGAAAIVGGMSARESKLDPTAVAKGDATDGSNSEGIAQWNRDRLAALKDFAQKHNEDYHDFRTQIEYLKFEGTVGLRKGVAEKLRGAATDEDATYIANHDFEGSADSPDARAAPQFRKGYQQRLEATKRLSAGGLRQPGISPDAGPGQLEAAENGARRDAEKASNPWADTDPDFASRLKEQAVVYTRQAYNQVTAAHSDTVNKATNGVYQAVEDGASLDQVKALPEWNQIPAEKQVSIQRRMSMVRKTQESLDTIKNHATLVGAAEENPAEFMKMDLDKLYADGKITQSDFADLYRRRDGIIRGLTKPVNAVSETNLLRGEGFFDGTDIDTDVNQRRAFAGMLQVAMEKRQLDGMKPMNRDEVRSLATDLMKAQVSQSKILGVLPWSSSQPSYNVAIPDDFRKGYIENWHKKNPTLSRDPSDNEMRLDYLRYLESHKAGS